MHQLVPVQREVCLAHAEAAVRAGHPGKGWIAANFAHQVKIRKFLPHLLFLLPQVRQVVPQHLLLQALARFLLSALLLHFQLSDVHVRVEILFFHGNALFQRALLIPAPVILDGLAQFLQIKAPGFVRLDAVKRRNCRQRFHGAA